MGTSLDAAVIATPTATAGEIAAILTRIGARAPRKLKVILSISQAWFSGLRLSWCTLVGPPFRSLLMSSVAAQQLSLTFGRALSVAFSDSLGECTTALFERGHEVSTSSTLEPPVSLRAGFAAAIAQAFSGCVIAEPEAALDILNGPDASSASFIIARSGLILPVPEIYPKGT